MGTIIADDTVFSISDVTLDEGNGGTTAFDFIVTRSGDTNGTSSVDYQTDNGIATVADSDYTPDSNTVNFAVGVLQQTISVDVIGDIDVEPDEDFFVDLSSADNGTILDGQGKGIITNDDSDLLTYSIDSITQAENVTPFV